MAAAKVDALRDQVFLLPPTIGDYVGDDHLVHFIIEVCKRVDPGSLSKRCHGGGKRQYCPYMMLTLIVYSYVTGVTSSRKIERNTWFDTPTIVAAGGQHPTFTTIAEFRRDNDTAFRALFHAVINYASQLNILKVGNVSIDATFIKANASKSRSIRDDRLQELREQIDMEIDRLIQEAEEADRMSDPENATIVTLGDDLRGGQKLRSRLDAVDREVADRLEAESEARNKRLVKLQQLRMDLDEADLAHREQARAKAEKEARDDARRRARDKANGKVKAKPRRGKNMIRVTDGDEVLEIAEGAFTSIAPAPDHQINLTDPDSNLMVKSYSGCVQGYNARAMVDADGTQLMLDGDVIRTTNEREGLVELVQGFLDRCQADDLGEMEYLVGDCGYGGEEIVKDLEEIGVTPLFAVARTDDFDRPLDFRPSPKKKKKPKAEKAPWKAQMRERLSSEAGSAVYRRRKCTVETVFGIMKNVMGFRDFRMRGLKNVNTEWQLNAAAYNAKRLAALIKQNEMKIAA